MNVTRPAPPVTRVMRPCLVIQITVTFSIRIYILLCCFDFHAPTHPHINTHTNTSAYMYVCDYTHLVVCCIMHLLVCICFMCMCTVCMWCVYVCVCMCVCVCVCMCVHVCRNIHCKNYPTLPLIFN